jgi:hypothetical protein
VEQTDAELLEALMAGDADRFSGATLLAVNVAPWGSVMTGHPDPRGIAFGHALAQPEAAPSEEVAVARQRPHPRTPLQSERLPAEHRGVEGRRAVGVAGVEGVEGVEVQRAGLVDDPGTPVRPADSGGIMSSNSQPKRPR